METPWRVAFVCPRMTNTSTRTYWYALQEAASDLGVRLTALVGGSLGSGPGLQVYGQLGPSNFDGAVLYTGALGFRVGPADLGRFLAGLGDLPLVSLGAEVEGLCSVSVDQGPAVADLVRHLHDTHGLRRFAFVRGPEGQIEATRRLEAFRQALDGLGVPADHRREFPGDYSRQAGRQAVRALDPTGPWPWALVCADDDEALGALEECRRLGYTVPGQVAVTGFDDIDQARLQSPPLPSVAQPLIRQARQALEALVARLAAPGTEVPSRVEAARTVYRESCGCRVASPAPQARDKAGLVLELLETQGNATESFRAFARAWLTDYLTAFEHLLDTGNPGVLRVLWARYYERYHSEQERGISYRRLFAGLEVLYGHRPRYHDAQMENVLLAGSAEARKANLTDQRMREFFFLLHGVEEAIGRIQDRTALAAFPFQLLAPLGILGLALVRAGDPPTLVSFRTRETEDSDPGRWGPLAYPQVLPPALDLLQPADHRIVVALAAEGAYQGHAVFWTQSQETFVCDFLANQWAGALSRIELLERLGAQQASLTESLEETRRMQEQLVETEKVASLGRLVAGVAHEINTPLGTGITGSSFLLDRIAEVRAQFASGTLARSTLEQFLVQGTEALEGVLRNLMKAGELIQAFKGLGLDHGQGEWRPVSLHGLFGDLGLLYSSELGKRGISLVCELPAEETFVYSQPSALVQIVSELLENAMEHAFPPGTTGEPQVLLQVKVEDQALRVAVTDNGRGLDPEERRHVFEPLYTTRRAEGHAGLGLHLAFQLVHRTLGGRMTLASEAGAGSCFLCLIPLKTP